MIAGAAIIFFAYIGFDAVSTQAEEAKNPQRDVPIGILGSLLICTVLYVAVVAVLTGHGAVRPDSTRRRRCRDGVRPGRAGVGRVLIVAAAAIAGITSVLLVMLLGSARVHHGHVARRAVAAGLLGHPPDVPDPVEGGRSWSGCSSP